MHGTVLKMSRNKKTLLPLFTFQMISAQILSTVQHHIMGRLNPFISILVPKMMNYFAAIKHHDQKQLRKEQVYLGFWCQRKEPITVGRPGRKWLT